MVKNKWALYITHPELKVIELSMDEARKLHHNFVGTEHILLGLIRENEGVAARVFANLDLNITKARAQVVKALGSPEMSNKMLKQINQITLNIR